VKLSLGKPVLSASVVVALMAVLALVVVMETAVVGRMAFNGDPFLLDPESLPSH